MTSDNDDVPARPVRRGKRSRKRRQAFRVPRALALVPALFFGAFGLISIGGGLLKAGMMTYFNLLRGPIANSGGLNPTFDNIALTSWNVANCLVAVAAGTVSLIAAARWLRGETASGMRWTIATVVVFFGGSWLASGLRYPGTAPPQVAEARPAVNAPSVVQAPPAAHRPPEGPRFVGSARPSLPMVPGQMMVSIFLDPMTDAERAKNLPLLQNEFRSLPNYVPDSVSIMGSTLYWKATIQRPQTEQHKLDAIAILRRNNVRLSKFSEDWLKNQARLRGNASAK